MVSLVNVPRELSQSGQQSPAAFTRTALMRGLAIMFFSATAVDEYSSKFAWQLLHSRAVSGEVALQFEQVCKISLRKYFPLYFTPSLFKPATGWWLQKDCCVFEDQFRCFQRLLAELDC